MPNRRSELCFASGFVRCSICWNEIYGLSLLGSVQVNCKAVQYGARPLVVDVADASARREGTDAERRG